LRIQAKKKTHTRFLRFEGSLDELSNQLNQGNQEKQTAKGLLSLIQSSKAISKLNLAIARIHFFTIQELVIFRKALKKHRSLRSFHFEFDKFLYFGLRNHLIMHPQLSNHLSKYHFQIFYQSLKKLSSLRDLSLTFGGDLVSSYALKTLPWEIKKTDFLDILDSLNDHDQRKLQYLEIKILNRTKPDSEGPPNVWILFKNNLGDDYNMDMVLKRNTHLWYLEGPKPSQKRGLKLTSEIFDFREQDIYSRKSNLTTQGLRHLNNALEEKQSFEYLMMEFSNCSFDKKELKRWTQNIKKSACLKRLEIVFPPQLALLEPHLLSWVKNLNISWISFTLGLKEPKTFKQTYLSLSGQLISDMTLQAFSSRLKKFSSLERIHIRFNKRDLEKIGQIDEGLLALKKSLMQLFLLQKNHLHLFTVL